jgi:hypothetical protein
VLFVVSTGVRMMMLFLWVLDLTLKMEAMYLRNVVIYRRPYTAPKPRRIASSSEGLLVYRFCWVGS